jgi:hypothetical protein
LYEREGPEIFSDSGQGEGEAMPLLIRPNPLSPNDLYVIHGDWQVGEIGARSSPLTGDAGWIWALNGVPAATPHRIRLAG